MTHEEYAAMPDGTVLIHREGAITSRVTLGHTRARRSNGTVMVYLERMRMWVKPAALHREAEAEAEAPTEPLGLEPCDDYAAWIADHTRNTDVWNTCDVSTQLMADAFPELRRVRGWVTVPGVGERPHWWLVDPLGNIVDPTARQFTDVAGDCLENGTRRMAYYGGAGIEGYREVDEENPPVGKCMQCGGTCYQNTAPCTVVCSTACERLLAAYYSQRG